MQDPILHFSLCLCRAWLAQSRGPGYLLIDECYKASVQPLPAETHMPDAVDISDIHLWVGSGHLTAVIPPKYTFIWQWLKTGGCCNTVCLTGGII